MTESTTQKLGGGYGGILSRRAHILCPHLVEGRWDWVPHDKSKMAVDVPPGDRQLSVALGGGYTGVVLGQSAYYLSFHSLGTRDDTVRMWTLPDEEGERLVRYTVLPYCRYRLSKIMCGDFWWDQAGGAAMWRKFILKLERKLEDGTWNENRCVEPEESSA